MRVVVDVSSNRYGSLASCCFPLAAVIPPRVAAGARFSPTRFDGSFPRADVWEALFSRSSAWMKTVCLARRSSPIAACGRVASESISLAVISGTRSRRARVRGAMRNTSRPDITKRTFPEPIFRRARHLASFPAFRGERFLGLTVIISRASRHHRQIRARGIGDGEESCAVCSRSIGGPKAETLTAECCRRRFHDLCIARHCATRRDEVPSPRTRRVFGGVVVHAPKRATIDRPDHQRLDGPFTFPSPPPPRRTAGFPPRVRRPFAEARGGRRGRRRIKRA